MPFTVITLKKVPDSLRGDLTRWMQEIATGVYVGNFNSRIREYLWKRVADTVGNGEAAMCYSCMNEIGYDFCTQNTQRQVVDYDGIPLVLIPVEKSPVDNIQKRGFSNASRYHRAKNKMMRTTSQEKQDDDEGISTRVHETKDFSMEKEKREIVFIDIETTGLNAEKDNIIEIGAIKVCGNDIMEYHKLINAEIHIPEAVQSLTGITDNMIKNGEPMKDCIYSFREFIKDSVLIGYNIAFDIKFLNKELARYSCELIHNKTVELMQEAKRRNSFQPNYRFETTLKEYGIDKPVPHRALEDAKLMYRLYMTMGIDRVE